MAASIQLKKITFNEPGFVPLSKDDAEFILRTEYKPVARLGIVAIATSLAILIERTGFLAGVYCERDRLVHQLE